jgi:4-phosphopantoate--beta-alanine ligase
VIAIDLNPLSRTAKAATVTIVDNVVRAIPNMIELALRMKNLDADRLDDIVSRYDNDEMLQAAIGEIVTRGVAGV